MPRQRFWLIFALLGAACTEAGAQNVTRLYPREKLEADALRYGGQIQAEFRETILPQLSEAERAALGGMKIDVPPAGPRGDPFEFYTDGRTIFLRALSLRFFADLCLAHAWLNAHDFDGTTVRDYVGLLFREASLSPSAPLPPVFKTLGVPENAAEESAVSNRADRNFGNTVVFLLAHELGHVLKKHRIDAHEPAQQRGQEIEADAFAIEIMRRIGQIPLGIEFWFDLERIRHEAPTKFPTDAEWQKYLATLDHPVTNERLNALAGAIEKAPDSFARNQNNQALWTARSGMFAQMFRLAAPFAGNAPARVAEYSRVRELRLAELKPRKAAFSVPGIISGAKDEDFQGLFRMRRMFADGRPAEEVDLLLLRSGDEVTGAYASGSGQGFIDGKIADGVFHFGWKEGKLRGRGQGTSAGGEMSGTWGIDGEDTGAGTWEGARAQRE